MVEALLVRGALELVVGRPAVVDHDAVVAEPQDGLGDVPAAGRVDDVSGGPGPDHGVQPRRASAHAPAGLVGHHPVRLPHGLSDGLIGRLAAGGGPENGVDAAATTERDAEEALQAAHDLAVRQAALLVEFDDGGLGVGPQLGRGSSERVGRLQGMAPLHPATALTAPADVDVELPVNGLARDLDLELLGDVSLVQGAATIGAAVRQRCLVDLVNLLGAGRLAVSLGAVVLAGLAARFARAGLGLALGEGAGLTLAGAEGRVELTSEPLILGLQIMNPPLKGLAAGAKIRLHVGIVRGSCARSGPGAADASI